MKRWLIILTLLNSLNAIAASNPHDAFRQKLFGYIVLQAPEMANQIVTAFMRQIDEIDKEDYDGFIQDQNAIWLTVNYIHPVLVITSIKFLYGFGVIFGAE